MVFPEKTMNVNIPKTSTVSHEVPIFTELARDSGLPVSEVKARFRNEIIKKHDEALDDPSTLPLGDNNDELVYSAVNSLRQNLEHPEETTSDDQEYDEIMGFDPNEPVPGADIFSPPGDDGFGGGDFGGGGFGGGDFGGAGGGIDNLDMGFSDEGMASLDTVNDEMDDFGSDESGDSVNAMSELEPGGEVEPSGDEEGSAEAPPDIGGDDLVEA